MDLHYFSDENFHGSLKRFFKELSIPVSYIAEEPTTAEEILENTCKPNNPAHQLMEDVWFLGMVDDEAFKKQTDELHPEFRKKVGKDYEGLLIFGVTLNSDKGRLPARGQMAEITRAFNREFHYTPVVVIFKYQQYISLANCERTAYRQKWREGEKVGRVSLLKDVDTRQPHTGHLKILQILEIRRKGKGAITSFEGLYQYWQEVFSISLLSKNFYRELSNWYFWALQHVDFPDDFEKDEQVRNPVNVIRLITRLMFCWFMKEKGLVPDTLFDEEELKGCLNFRDVNGSTYYKAILQNLFFATLNTEMRKDNPGSRQFVNCRYGIQEFYRHDRLFRDKKDALELFKNIPFLNGGLFENLDRNVGRPDEIRIDCFSDRPANSERLRVPDFLFFGDENEVDLSRVCGDKKRKKETVRGLIRILKSYKFTIAENTPVEEEIALDPELLGKIFENLLASYNPETQTTARKQTGSFYTPREIVNYMVDESLTAYFSNALAPADDEDLKKALDDKLHQLLSYSPERHLFNDNEVGIIINALDNAKILDPACGSGAFPMGILHKMVHILSKIDPENARWKQKQMDKIAEISDITVREKLLEDVEESFRGNELDYGRKLHLIQNCVFGVDIQPIAVQIAKLRFFISLVADQKVDRGKKNLGILPLPNLETKFVAANTLMGIERSGQLMLQSLEIDKKQDELADARQKHFSARTPKTKAKYRESDENLRAELARLLKERGSFGEDVAEKLANWDPYNQNVSADFFDPEWMFGIKDGFDIVIGNPPYIQIQKFSSLQKVQWEEQQYQTFDRMGDIYCLFYEKGYQLLAASGLLCFISSNKWMRAGYGVRLRKFFSEQTAPLLLIDFGNVRVFDATVNANILLMQKAANQKQKRNQNQMLLCRIDNDFNLTEPLAEYVSMHRYRMMQPNKAAWVVGTKDMFDITTRIEKQGIPLKDWNVKIYRGIITGCNDAFIIDRETKNRLAEDPKNAELLKPVLTGKDIQKWKAEFKNMWLINTHNGLKKENIPPIDVEKNYPVIWKWLEQFRKRLEKRQDKGEHWTNLRNCSYLEEFENPKIIWGNLTLNAKFALDTEHFYLTAPSNLLTCQDPKEIKYLLAVLNSKISSYYMRQTGYSREGGYLEYKKIFVEKIPVKKISPSEQEPFIRLVDYILFLKQQSLTTSTEKLMPVFFEHIINGLSYELYLPESVRKTEGRAFAKYLQNLPDISIQSDKMRCVSETFTKLHKQDHPIRNAIFFIDSAPEIAMIEKTVRS